MANHEVESRGLTILNLKGPTWTQLYNYMREGFSGEEYNAVALDLGDGREDLREQILGAARNLSLSGQHLTAERIAHCVITGETGLYEVSFGVADTESGERISTRIERFAALRDLNQFVSSIAGMSLHDLEDQTVAQQMQRFEAIRENLMQPKAANAPHIFKTLIPHVELVTDFIPSGSTSWTVSLPRLGFDSTAVIESIDMSGVQSYIQGLQTR